MWGSRSFAARGLLVLALLTIGGASVWPAGADSTSNLAETFIANGPAPIDTGNTGAIHAVIVDPTDPNTVWIGAENGGIWKTTNFHPEAPLLAPTWTPLTDSQPSLAIGALAFDPTDPTYQTVVAGTGARFTPHGISTASVLTGLMKTDDGGAHWTQLGTADLAQQKISGVVPRGADIVTTTEDTGGAVWRSTDGGVSFTKLSGGVLPVGSSTSAAGDTAHPDRIYVAILGADGGVFRSDDKGATWIAEGSSALKTAAASALKLTLTTQSYPSGATVVLLGVVDSTGALTTIFRSPDSGASWTAFAAPPAAPLNLTRTGLVSDPTTPSFFYVAGDEGPVFRCPADAVTGNTCVDTTGDGSASDTEPHPDAWQLAFDGSDTLLYADDGGLWERTNARDEGGLGDWYPRNGSMAVTEPVSCGWDHRASVALCGLTDNGVVMQQNPGDSVWTDILGADGGVVAVSDAVTPCPFAPFGSCSTRYYSSQMLGNLTRATCDANNTCVTVRPALLRPGGDSLGCTSLVDPNSCTDPGITFDTPINADRFDGQRLVIGTGTVYESTDGGEHLMTLSGFAGTAKRAIVYGGRVGGNQNTDLLYVGSDQGLFVRTGGGAGSPLTKSAYDVSTMGEPNRIVLNPNDGTDAWVVTNTRQVWHTPDAGATWDEITGDLLTGGPGARSLLSVAYIPNGASSIIAVGGPDGVYVTDTNPHVLGHWSKLTGALPNAPVVDLRYDGTDDVLLIATSGRSTWLIRNASSMTLPPVLDASTSDTTGDFNDSTTLRASLKDGNDGSAIIGAPIHFTLGTQSCDATTGPGGVASCDVLVQQKIGDYTVEASFAGDSSHAASYDTEPYTIVQEDTAVAFTAASATAGDFHDTVTVTATLFDPTDGVPIDDGRTITFAIGADSCFDSTNLNGRASCSITLTQKPGPYTLTAMFGGAVNFKAASASTPFTINKEETSTAYTGPTFILQGGSGATLTGTLLEDGNASTPIAGRTLALTLGTQTCTGTTNASGVAQCTIVFTGPLGPQPLTARFTGDDYYLPSSDTTHNAVVFAFPSRGAFTLGDVTVAQATATTSVTWWADNWSTLNVVSTGPGPSSFKGFASTVSLPTSTPPPACGGNWASLPGNSPPPTSGVPSYMGVLVAGSVTKSGNDVNGTTVRIVVVKIGPGYAPSPTSHGTGTILGTYC